MSVGSLFHSLTSAAPRHSRIRRSISSNPPASYGKDHVAAGAPPSPSQRSRAVAISSADVGALRRGFLAIRNFRTKPRQVPFIERCVPATQIRRRGHPRQTRPKQHSQFAEPALMAASQNLKPVRLDRPGRNRGSRSAHRDKQCCAPRLGAEWLPG